MLKDTNLPFSPQAAEGIGLAAALGQVRVQVLLLLLLCGVTFFPNLSASDPTLMEARNFITVREMTESGQWLIPTLNGEKRLAKPPLPTWITALSGLAAGDVENRTALRFPAAVAATLMVFFLFLLARCLTRDRFVPFLAAASLCAFFGVVTNGRQGTWDIYCHSFMLGSIWLLVKGCKEKGANYGTFAWSGVLLGCAFLSKGPVPLYAMLLPFLVSYGYAFGLSEARAHKKGILLGLFVGVVLSAAWPLYTYFSVAEELTQNVQAESTAWLTRHVKPLWYYWGFPAQAGILALVATAALAVPYARGRVGYFGKYKFLFAWVVITFLLLSVVPEKKERYLLPLLPPLALLTGFYLRYLLESLKQTSPNKWDKRIGLLNTTVFILAAFAFPLLAYGLGYSKGLLSILALAVFTTVSWLLGIAMLMLARRRLTEGVFLAALLLNALVLTVGAPLFEGIRYTHNAYQSLRSVRNVDALQPLPFYAVGGMGPQAIWDVGKQVGSLQVTGQKLELPSALPAAIFSPFPLDPSFLPDNTLMLQQVSEYRYNRKNPEDVYYVYTLLAQPVTP